MILSQSHIGIEVTSDHPTVAYFMVENKAPSSLTSRYSKYDVIIIKFGLACPASLYPICVQSEALLGYSLPPDIVLAGCPLSMI